MKLIVTLIILLNLMLAASPRAEAEIYNNTNYSNNDYMSIPMGKGPYFGKKDKYKYWRNRNSLSCEH